MTEARSAPPPVVCGFFGNFRFDAIAGFLVFRRIRFEAVENATKGSHSSSGLTSASAQAQTVNVRQYLHDHQPEILREFAALLSPGDTIVDGGNTNYRDDVRRATTLATSSISYIDAGTSLEVGEKYEYDTSAGYLMSGINARPVENRGRIVASDTIAGISPHSPQAASVARGLVPRCANALARV